MAYLQTAISALKLDASVDDVNDAYRLDVSKRYNVPLTINKQLDAREIEARGWQHLVERRDMVEGEPLSRLGSYTGLGYFVPTDFFPQVFAALAAHDALFDEDSCTVIKTKNGRPITVPVFGDIENVATVVGEAGSQLSTDISSTGQGKLGAYSYKTPRMVFSIESFQDIDEAFGNINLFKQVTADRLARGIAKDLGTGSGSSKPLGLVPSLEAAGVPYVTASGSAANSGGSETGTAVGCCCCRWHVCDFSRPCARHGTACRSKRHALQSRLCHSHGASPCGGHHRRFGPPLEVGTIGVALFWCSRCDGWSKVFMAGVSFMNRTIRRVLLIAASLLALPTAALAHLTGTGLGPFYDGVTHFFLSPEQIIPLLAVGLFADLRGKRSGRIALFLLSGAWIIGGSIGIARPVTGQFTLLTCFSFLVLGAFVALDAKLEPRFVAMLGLGFGLALGYVNGSDLSTTSVGTLGVLGTATSIFVLVALVSAFVASLRVPWTRIVVRVAGSWIVAAGLLLFGWAVHERTPKLRSETSTLQQNLFVYAATKWF